MFWFVLYIIGIFSFILWDAVIGLGTELDGISNPSLTIGAIFWFIFTPILLVFNFVQLCQYLKESRFKREEDAYKEKIKIQNKQEKIRIQTERDIEEALLELDKEIKIKQYE